MPASITRAIREQLVAALEQRAARLDGEARRVLDDRLAALHGAAAVEMADAACNETQAHPTPGPGPLRELVDSIAHDASDERATYPELPALDAFRTLWSGIRSDSQLQQSVAHTPTDAGPLNSAALASRAIALMRELSPGYLRRFLAYVDDLAWVEQLGAAGPAVSTAAHKKRASRKARG